MHLQLMLRGNNLRKKRKKLVREISLDGLPFSENAIELILPA